RVEDLLEQLLQVELARDRLVDVEEAAVLLELAGADLGRRGHLPGVGERDRLLAHGARRDGVADEARGELLEEDVRRPDRDRVARPDRRLLRLRAVDERPVAAAEVDDLPRALEERDLAVMAARLGL